MKSEPKLGLPAWVWILIAIPVLIFPFLRHPPEHPPHELTGKNAPDFTFLDRETKPHQLSEYKGRVILLNFWASWCGPCMSEMASLKALHQTLSPRGLDVLAINIDDSLEQILRLSPKRLDSLPPLFFHSPSGRGLSEYRVSALPFSVVIDKTGKIIKTFYGAYEWNAQSFEPLLLP